MERMLPRHMQIIYLINAYHIDALRAKGLHDFDVLRAVSLIEEDNGRRVRMGNLAFLGSHSVNGVSALHSRLMRSTVFAELHKLYPQRINNKTNGITFRRWLYQANPQLTAMLVDALGPEVLDDPESRLKALVPFAEKATFRKQFAAQRLHSKRALASIIQIGSGSRSTRRRCSTCRSSASTSTSANCSTCCTPWPCTRPCAPSPGPTGCRG